MVSIVRFGSDGSDVYVYESSRGLECCGCNMRDAGYGPLDGTVAEMVEHLKRHVAAGDCVPEYVFEELVDYKIGDWE